MGTVFHQFPNEKRAFINPEDTTERNPDFPTLCVSTFSENIINKFAAMDQVEEIGRLYTANGSLPVYKIVYKDTPIAFFLSRVGAPACVSGLEEVIAMGAERIVMFGSRGILDQSVDGKMIVPISAVRDEGTSYHYLEPSDEVYAQKEAVRAMAESLENCGYPYIAGKTWTTDAIYRETPSVISERKKAGCICVEMECASVLAAAEFRKIPLAYFLYGADNLDCSGWEMRDLAEYGLSGAEKYMMLAFECALRMGKNIQERILHK